ncbi:uncharacterized protein [Macrobrachium rosenbergii]|uniref:uncharacterized protein n=1 Tax=Macrobrachium rosenbergii TaxID=79674 RepID=UPI0034D66B62
MAARVDHKLREELCLELEESVLWSDSTLVLKYLFNVKARYQMFMANRINLICELTPITTWRYVDTAKNLVDLASRGIDADSPLTSKMWFQGPAFLVGPESSWPTTPSDVKVATLKGDPEVKRTPLLCDAVTKTESFIEQVAKSCSMWP